MKELRVILIRKKNHPQTSKGNVRKAVIVEVEDNAEKLEKLSRFITRIEKRYPGHKATHCQAVGYLSDDEPEGSWFGDDSKLREV